MRRLRHCARTVAFLTALGAVQVTSTALGADRFWINGAGSVFTDTFAWTPTIVPTAVDHAHFTSNSSYRILWTAKAINASDGFWSNGANRLNGVAPQAGERLVFPPDAVRFTKTNDFAPARASTAPPSQAAIMCFVDSRCCSTARFCPGRC